MEDPDAVGETGMSSTGIDQFGEPELLDSSQPLKWSAAQHVPKHAFQLLTCIEYDEVMNRIADALMCQFSQEAYFPKSAQAKC